MAVGFLLEVQRQMYWVPVLFVACLLMIIPHASDALIVECLSWFVIVARYMLDKQTLNIIY